MVKPSAEEIDQHLPQTQCGLCGYGGCLPYAKALSTEDAAINLCPPGGVETLNKLAVFLQKDASPFIADMQAKAKPPMLAVIREAECIGCTKCIDACPVDAILGTAKKMHTVLRSECTGCELCLPACPVDCIDLVEGVEITQARSDYFRMRFQNRELRRDHPLDEARCVPMKLEDKKDYIKAALLRVKK